MHKILFYFSLIVSFPPHSRMFLLCSIYFNITLFQYVIPIYLNCILNYFQRKHIFFQITVSVLNKTKNTQQMLFLCFKAYKLTWSTNGGLLSGRLVSSFNTLNSTKTFLWCMKSKCNRPQKMFPLQTHNAVLLYGNVIFRRHAASCHVYSCSLNVFTFSVSEVVHTFSGADYIWAVTSVDQSPRIVQLEKSFFSPPAISCHVGVRSPPSVLHRTDVYEFFDGAHREKTWVKLRRVFATTFKNAIPAVRMKTLNCSSSIRPPPLHVRTKVGAFTCSV